ncbi:MAG: BlaI/MecI/CopY family transcriptional regulator [Gemmatimonadaceae bacterium]
MDPQFTDRELDIMHVLWDVGGATATEVQERLSDKLAYNTVLTMLRILEEKGFVRHEEQGRAFRYLPKVARKKAKASAVKRLVSQLFDGEARLLATELMSSRTLSESDLRELRALLDERLEKRDK